METDKNLEIIRNYIAKMPSLPVTVSKILEICRDPRTSPNDLNRVISLDPVLMGRVMKLINSAYYGLSQQVTSLVRAIIMLGINTVKNLALSTAVLGSLGSKSNFHALNMDGFWRHSLCVGVTCKLIASKRGVNAQLLEEYFVAGLLHDIGKIPMNNKLSEDYVLSMSISDRDHLPLYISEKKALGFDHAEVGKFIGESWKLGSEIVETVSFHHSIDQYKGKNPDLVYSVVLANYFANSYEIGFSGDRYPEKVNPTVLTALKLDWDFLEDLEDTVNKEIDKAKIFLHAMA